MWPEWLQMTGHDQPDITRLGGACGFLQGWGGNAGVSSGWGSELEAHPTG